MTGAEGHAERPGTEIHGAAANRRAATAWMARRGGWAGVLRQ